MTFFNAIWTKGRNLHIVSGPIKYAQLTPSWLTNKTIFMCGRQRNISVPFTKTALPSKNQIRERGKKMLGCAILATWMKREAPSAIYLRTLLHDRGINVADDAESSSVIDLAAVNSNARIDESSNFGAIAEERISSGSSRSPFVADAENRAITSSVNEDHQRRRFENAEDTFVRCNSPIIDRSSGVQRAQVGHSRIIDGHGGEAHSSIASHLPYRLPRFANSSYSRILDESASPTGPIDTHRGNAIFKNTYSPTTR